MTAFKRILAPRRMLFAAVTLSAFCISLAAPTEHSAALAQGKKGDKFGKDPGTGGVIVKSSPKFLAVFKEVVAKANPSVVRVQCDGKDTALGVAVTAEGFILTKHSDLNGKITVKLRDGEELEAKIVGVHQGHDLAMLKVYATGLTPVTFKDSKSTPAGHLVASPGMTEEPVAIGVVSVPTRNMVTGGKVDKGTPPVPNANSGFLGIGLEDGSPTGARVTEVQPKSAAEKGGIKVNDVVLAVAGKAIDNANTLIETMQGYKPGETVDLKLLRGDEELGLKVTLGQRPKDKGGNRADFQNNLGSELSKRRTGFPTILQHDQVIRPADCGGPLVDLNGHVIAINIARAGRVESYAVPAEVIQPILRDLMSGKLAPPAAKKDAPKEKEKSK